MAFLTVNGITLELMNGSVNEMYREIGEQSTSYAGTMRKSRQTTKRDFSATTPPMLATEAEPWELLLRGVGEHFSFTSHVYSDGKGFPPTTVDATVAVAAVNNPFTAAAGALLIPGNAAAKKINYTPSPTLTNTATAAAGRYYTIAYYRSVDAGTTWTHHLTTIDGSTTTKYDAGVSGGAGLTTGLTLPGSGVVQLNGQVGATPANDTYYSDLVIVPFLVPTTWIATLAAATRLFSDLPKLTLSGDLIGESLASRTAVCSVKSELVKGYMSASFRNNLRKLQLEFSGV